MAVQLPRRRFTVDEFERMIDAGVFPEDDRVELIDGEVVTMAALGLRHAESVRSCNDLFSDRARGSAIVDVQNPLDLRPRARPEPGGSTAGSASPAPKYRLALLAVGGDPLLEVVAAGPGDRELDLVDPGEAGVALDGDQVQLGLAQRQRSLLRDRAGQRLQLGLDLLDRADPGDEAH